MGRIRILSDQVANQIAAGEVVDRPASVVKELLENALDAGATRIRIEVEAGGKKLIRISDDGCGMVQDDALLAFERHATSKLRTADDLLSIATLGFRGEALPSIASVARVALETSTGEGAGTKLEIAGGKILHVEDAALAKGTTIAISDLFYNVPARRKFLRAEQTELSHITALVTHYALVHPEMHFELRSATHTLLDAPPVERAAERIYQVFGKETLELLLPVAAEMPLERSGLPAPPPWKLGDEKPRLPGALRMTGFYSVPELQKLNRNSIYIFVNQRLIRDRLMLHAINEAYRNVIPPTSYPVVLLFLEMPPEEVDVNVHPAKTEVRFRQQGVVHDFVRDSLRRALIDARPAAHFPAGRGEEVSSSILPPMVSNLPGVPDSEPIRSGSGEALNLGRNDSWQLRAKEPAPIPGRLNFGATSSKPEAPGVEWQGGGSWRDSVSAMLSPLVPPAAGSLASAPDPGSASPLIGDVGSATAKVEASQGATNLSHLANLRPLGQLRESFILATGEDGLWIIDQHVAHERILFEKILAEREVERIQRQRFLMPILVELKPWQMVVFAQIAEELEKNGFDVEPFGPQTLAVKAAPVGLEGVELERMITEVIEFAAGDSKETQQNENLEALRGRIAASMACHAAVKVNMPLDVERMRWLLEELSKTSHPTNCPHGRPIALLYSWKEIQRAFERV